MTFRILQMKMQIEDTITLKLQKKRSVILSLRQSFFVRSKSQVYKRLFRIWWVISLMKMSLFLEIIQQHKRGDFITTYDTFRIHLIDYLLISKK